MNATKTEAGDGGFNGPGGRENFIRFGDKPDGGNSYNNATDALEEGLSAFTIREDDEGLYFTAGSTDMGPLLERPAYLLTGNFSSEAEGGDGEALVDPESAKSMGRVKIAKDGRKYRIIESELQ